MAPTLQGLHVSARVRGRREHTRRCGAVAVRPGCTPHTHTGCTPTRNHTQEGTHCIASTDHAGLSSSSSSGGGACREAGPLHFKRRPLSRCCWWMASVSAAAQHLPQQLLGSCLRAVQQLLARGQRIEIVRQAKAGTPNHSIVTQHTHMAQALYCNITPGGKAASGHHNKPQRAKKRQPLRWWFRERGKGASGASCRAAAKQRTPGASSSAGTPPSPHPSKTCQPLRHGVSSDLLHLTACRQPSAAARRGAINARTSAPGGGGGTAYPLFKGPPSAAAPMTH